MFLTHWLSYWKEIYISLGSRPLVFSLVYAESVFVLALLNQIFLKFLRNLMLLAISHSEWKKKLTNKTKPLNDQTPKTSKESLASPKSPKPPNQSTNPKNS